MLSSCWSSGYDLAQMNLPNVSQPTHAGFLLMTFLIAFGATGCKHQPTAREKQMAAFQAGQQRVISQMMEARRTSIRIIGNVRYPEISWSDGLTLGKAIVAAEILDRGNPKMLFIYRQSGQIPVEPAYLLGGGDVPLEPGDTIQIQP